jgi:hypothetical protein
MEGHQAPRGVVPRRKTGRVEPTIGLDASGQLFKGRCAAHAMGMRGLW